MRANQLIPSLALTLFLVACKTTPETGEGLQVAPVPLAYNSPIDVADNLDGPSRLDSQDGRAIHIALQRFEQAYEQDDTQLAAAVFAADFVQIEIVADDQVRRRSLQSYMMEFGQKIDVSLSHISHDQESGNDLVVARLEHEGKWFRRAEIVTFIFDRDAPERIRAMIAMPIYAEAYPEGGVEIFVVDRIAEDELKSLLNLEDPDAALDELLSARHVAFPWQRNATVIFVFKEPPPPGSTIKTEILMDAGFAKASGSYDYVVDEGSPYVVVANDGYLHAKKATIYIKAYVDGRLIASKTMQR